MSMDTRTERTLTIADLCQAIAERTISYTQREDVYVLTGLDVRRFLRGDERVAAPTPIDPYLASVDPSCFA